MQNELRKAKSNTSKSTADENAPKIEIGDTDASPDGIEMVTVQFLTVTAAHPKPQVSL